MMWILYNLAEAARLDRRDYDYCMELMPDERRAQVLRLRFEKDRALTVAGELLARRMIARVCDIQPESIVLRRTDRGKPFAVGMPVHFSVSHSCGLVLCAVSDSPVGADIEYMRPVKEKLIRRVCTGAEAGYVLHPGISVEEQHRRFFRVWTGKEAFFKRQGTGILSLRSISIFDESVSRELTSFYVGNYAVSILGEGTPEKNACIAPF